MCPACLATISMIVAGAFSTGGATVLAAKTLLRKKETARKGLEVSVSEEFRSPKEKENSSWHKAA
jgi:uncharacterized OsmC-like protein